MSKKNQLIIFLIFSIIVLIYYSSIPITLYTGDKTIGIITVDEYVGGKHPSKTITYIKKDRIENAFVNGNYEIEDYFSVYYKNIFGIYSDQAGEKLKNQHLFLLYSENIPKNVNVVKLFQNGRTIKQINVRYIKNFGYYIKNNTETVVYYDKKFITKIVPNEEIHNFKNLNPL